MARLWPRQLFVYGTLLTSAEHPLGDLLRQHGTLIGTGSIQARLYLITEEDAEGDNTFPAALPSDYAQDRVFGELYDISDPERVYPDFDAYEACSEDWPEPHEFLLRLISVTLDNSQTIEAGCYLYTYDISRATPISSGRFVDVARRTR